MNHVDRLEQSRAALRSAIKQSPAPAPDKLKAAEQVANVLLRPLATRHPWLLVGGSLAAGAVVTWAMPWRRVLRPAVVMGWAAPVMLNAIKPLTTLSWMSLIQALMQAHQVPHPTANTPTGGQTTPTGAAARAASATAPG